MAGDGRCDRRALVIVAIEYDGVGEFRNTFGQHGIQIIKLCANVDHVIVWCEVLYHQEDNGIDGYGWSRLEHKHDREDRG